MSTSCCRGPLFVDADEPIYYNMRGVAIMNGGGDRRWKLMIDDWMTNRRRKSDNDGVDSVLELASNNNGCHVNDAPVMHRPRSACRIVCRLLYLLFLCCVSDFVKECIVSMYVLYLVWLGME